MARTQNTPTPDTSEDDDTRAARFPRSWRPDQDDPHTLRGKLVDVSIGVTMYGQYPILTINTGVELFAWHAMQQLAKEELRDANPEMGDELEIVYGGKVKQVKDTGKNPYVAWSVTNHTRPKDVKGILSRVFGTGPATPATVTPGGEFADEPPF